MPSLTGSPETDRLIPAATRLVCGLREYNPHEVAAAFADAEALTTGNTTDAARALAVLLGALVPWEAVPADLLSWLTHEDDYHRLRAAGIDPPTAATLCDRTAKDRRQAQGR